MRVHHALGAPGGARGVAHGHGVVFSMRCVVKTAGIRVGQPLLVVEKLAGHSGARKGKDDDFLKRIKVLKLAVQGQQNIVDDQNFVLRIVGDPCDLFGRQT